VGTFRALGRRLDSGDSTVLSSATSTDGFNYLAGSFVWGGNLLQFRHNSTDASSATFASGAGLTSATDAAVFNIGAGSTVSNRMNGVVSELLADRAVYTSAQLTALQNFYKQYYPTLP
jgi:hypothetical protein